MAPISNTPDRATNLSCHASAPPKTSSDRPTLADAKAICQHFRGKPDISGTARRLADSLGLDVSRQVNSVRVGGIVGKHEVIFGFPYQTLRLVHESISRNAFGQGALYAVKRLMHMATGYYIMDELIRDEFHNVMPA